MGFGFLFNGMFSLVFILVISMFVIMAVKALRQWNRNNHSPRLAVEARVAAKRTDVTCHQHPVGGDVSGAQGFHTSTSTDYYITFEVESGDRIEFSVNGSEYGMLLEGDFGKLYFQGTRYLGFERR